MSFVHFLRLLKKNLIWLILIPIVLASTIFYLTRNEVKVYSSETIIYTGIASGYGLNGNNKADFFTASNAFDNLISIINARETKLETAVDLLCEHLMLQKHDPDAMSWGSYTKLKNATPDSIKRLIIKPTLQETKKAAKQMMLTNEDNWVYKTINSGSPFYSIDALKNVKALRISMSDLIKISYETNDAAICKRTLELLLKEFMNKYKVIKEGQTESVVKYFEDETKNAYTRLDSNEANFLDFNKSNDIINYYEQTRSLAGEKELLYAQNHNLEMERQADDKTLVKVNENLEGRVYKILNGTDIVKEREKLSDVNNKIAVTEILAKDKNNPIQKGRIDSMKTVAKVIEGRLKNSMDKLYAQSNTPEGIPTRQVLDEWLKSTLAYEQSKAKLTVMDKRKKEFVVEYRKFAPLGAMLKKIERQIGVSEKEYLELLHGLSMARLTQQNNELTTKLTTLDAPFLPVSANPSKRMAGVIAGFMVGFILVLTTILVKALMNKALQTPVKVKKAIGQPILGIYPLLKAPKVLLEKANLRLVQKLISRIDITEKPAIIGFISAQEKEGKTTMINLFFDELTKLQYKVEKQSWSMDQLMGTAKNTEVILLEITALERLAMKPGAIPTLQQSVLVSRANRVWTPMDTELLNIFKKVTASNPVCLLNGVEIPFAEDILGKNELKKGWIATIITFLKQKITAIKAKKIQKNTFVKF